MFSEYEQMSFKKEKYGHTRQDTILEYKPARAVSPGNICIFVKVTLEG